MGPVLLPSVLAAPPTRHVAAESPILVALSLVDFPQAPKCNSKWAKGGAPRREGGAVARGGGGDRGTAGPAAEP